MTRFIIACVVGLGTVAGGRWLVEGRSPASVPVTADRPSTAPSAARRGAGPARQREGRLEQATPEAPDRAPDLQPFDDFIARFYGEPIPWDSDELRHHAEAAFEDGAVALADAGLGEVVHLDCSSYPCLAVVETDLAAREAASQVLGQFDVEAHVWSAMRVPVEFGAERTVTRLLLAQDAEDLSAWDPVLQLRKEDLSAEFLSASYLPTPQGADQPRTWPGASAP